MRAMRWTLVAAVTTAATGCGPGRPDVPPEVRRAGAALDRAEASVEEWGTVTVSAPLLEAPDGGGDRFQFDLKNKGPDEYFADAQANVQGRAADFEQVVSRFGLGIDVGLNPMIADQYFANVARYHRQQADYEADEANRRALARRQQEMRIRAAESRYQEQTRRAEMTRDAAHRDAKTKYDGAMQAAGTDEAKKAAAKSQYDLDVAAADATYDAAVAKADQARADAVQPPGAGTAPDYPAPATRPALADEKTAPDASGARGTLASQTFKDAMALLPSTRRSPVLADRTAINIAAGDTATEAIFSLLGNPDLAARFKDRQVLFGVSMVAVNPGWRTRKGYAADVAVICRYSYVPARRAVIEAFVADELVDPRVRKLVARDHGVTEGAPGKDVPAAQKIPSEWDLAQLDVDGHGVPRDGGPSPLVAAVSPMTETQALDLESSNRVQRELAIRLSFALQAAGLTAQAAAFQQFVRSLQQDVETATAMNTVNAYSHVGGMFGFQIGPRLVAIESVRKGKAPGAAEVLDRQSFPTLIILGVNRPDTVRLSRGDDGKVKVYEARLLLTSQPAWTPTEASTARDRLRPSERLAMAYEMIEATGTLATTARSPRAAEPLGPVSLLADTRRYMLRYKFFGGNVRLMMPADTFRHLPTSRPSTRPTTGPASAAGS